MGAKYESGHRIGSVIMNSTEFKAIEQYDVIEGIWGKGTEAKRGSVLKDSDNRVLVGGVHKSLILRREKGFWLTVGPKDVIRVVKKFSDTGSGNREGLEAAKQELVVSFEKYWDLI